MLQLEPEKRMHTVLLWQTASGQLLAMPAAAAVSVPRAQQWASARAELRSRALVVLPPATPMPPPGASMAVHVVAHHPHHRWLRWALLACLPRAAQHPCSARFLSFKPSCSSMLWTCCCSASTS